HAIAVDIDAPRCVARYARRLRIIERRFVDLRHTGGGVVGAQSHSKQMSRSGVGGGKPDRTIRGVDDGSVAIYGDSLVNRWIDLTVAVGINISRAPSLSLLGISGRIKNASIEPAEGLPTRPAKE